MLERIRMLSLCGVVIRGMMLRLGANRRCVLPGALALAALGLAGPARSEPALQVESRIQLPGVAGRIDHMAVDLRRKRLFVAEFGNGSLDVVDLAAGRQIKRISGLVEPQGVGYAAAADLVAVAQGGDGRVRFYRGEGLAAAGVLALGSDADDIRVDPRSRNLVVGYGEGGLAIIDPDTRSKIGEINLAAHPEGFAIDATARRAYVNLPEAAQIAVVELSAGRQTAAWRLSGMRANFPIALDRAERTVASVFRAPPKLALIDAASGAVAARLDACGDADDVFFDDRRRRIYISCGEGFVDVFATQTGGSYAHFARIATAPGARTSLFVPEFDRLFVAARAAPSRTAAIIVLRPLP